MRTVKSLFGRNSKSAPDSASNPKDEQKRTAHIFTNRSRKSVVPDDANRQSVQAGEFGESSSTSSRLTTSDSAQPVVDAPTGKRWTLTFNSSRLSLGPKKSAKHTGAQPGSDESHTHIQPTLRPPIITSPDDSSDEDSSSESEDDYDSPPTPLIEVPSHTNESLSSRLRLVTQNGSLPPYAPPPLLELPHSAIHPRSVNIPSMLSRTQTLFSKMAKEHIAQSINSGHLPLSKEAGKYLQNARLTIPATKSLILDDTAIPDTAVVHFFSRGLACWRARGTFEERVMVWTLSSTGELQKRIVSGTEFGVEALDISAHLDALAGDGDATEPAPSPPFLSPSNTGSSTSVVSKTMPPLPSPLRKQHNSVTSSLTITQSVATKTSKPSKGVHFVEEDDQPLGQVYRSKRKEQEKARADQQDRDRRAFLSLHAAQERERKHQEEKRLAWERERAAYEQERKAVEEERRQRAYAKEITAARARREASRSGSLRPTVDKVSARAYSDQPRRATSEYVHGIPEMRRTASYSPASSASQSPNNGSPIASDGRPNSTNSARTSISSLSELPAVPPELGPRRSSLPAPAKPNRISMSSVVSSPMMPMPPMMPMLPTMGYPPMDIRMTSPMPMYPYDMSMMPLLPPNPAFMMNQSRSRSNSRSRQQSSSPKRSSTGSKEALTQTSNSYRERLPSSGSRSSRIGDQRSGSSSAEVSPKAPHEIYRGGQSSSRTGSAADLYLAQAQMMNRSTGDLSGSISKRSSTWSPQSIIPVYPMHSHPLNQQSIPHRGRTMVPQRQSFVT